MASILVVDDEQMLLDLLTEILETEGHHITAQASPEKVLEDFQSSSQKFDLAIFDLNLEASLTGDQLATAIWKIKPGLPIILFTGSILAQELPHYRQLGFSGVIIKPLDVPTIISAVNNILG